MRRPRISTHELNSEGLCSQVQNAQIAIPSGTCRPLLTSKKGVPWNSSPMGITVEELLLFLVVILLPFENTITILGGSLVKYATLLFLAAATSRPNQYFAHWPPGLQFYLGYAFIGFIGDICSPVSREMKVMELLQPALVGLLIVPIYNYVLLKGPKRLVFALIGGSGIYIMFQYFQRFIGQTSDSLRVEGPEMFERVSALSTDPNFGACFSSIAVIAGCAGLFGLVPLGLVLRCLGLVGSILGVFGILMSGSRGGLIACAIGLVTLVSLRQTLMSRLRALLVLFMLGCVTVSYIGSDPLLLKRFASTIKDHDVATRDSIISDAISLGLDAPLFGLGAKSHMIVLGRHRGGEIRGTHNTIVAVFVGTGVAGTLLFFSFVWAAVSSGFRLRGLSYGKLLIGWSAMLAVGCQSINLESGKLLFIILAIVLAVGNDQWSPRLANRLSPHWNGNGSGR